MSINQAETYLRHAISSLRSGDIDNAYEAAEKAVDIQEGLLVVVEDQPHIQDCNITIIEEI